MRYDSGATSGSAQGSGMALSGPTSVQFRPIIIDWDDNGPYTRSFVHNLDCIFTDAATVDTLLIPFRAAFHGEVAKDASAMIRTFTDIAKTQSDIAHLPVELMSLDLADYLTPECPEDVESYEDLEDRDDLLLVTLHSDGMRWVSSIGTNARRPHFATSRSEVWGGVRPDLTNRHVLTQQWGIQPHEVGQ